MMTSSVLFAIQVFVIFARVLSIETLAKPSALTNLKVRLVIQLALLLFGTLFFNEELGGFFWGGYGTLAILAIFIGITAKGVKNAPKNAEIASVALALLAASITPALMEVRLLLVALLTLSGVLLICFGYAVEEKKQNKVLGTLLVAAGWILAVCSVGIPIDGMTLFEWPILYSLLPIMVSVYGQYELYGPYFSDHGVAQYQYLDNFAASIAAAGMFPVFALTGLISPMGAIFGTLFVVATWAMVQKTDPVAYVALLLQFLMLAWQRNNLSMAQAAFIAIGTTVQLLSIVIWSELSDRKKVYATILLTWLFAGEMVVLGNSQMQLLFLTTSLAVAILLLIMEIGVVNESLAAPPIKYAAMAFATMLIAVLALSSYFSSFAEIPWGLGWNVRLSLGMNFLAAALGFIEANDANGSSKIGLCILAILTIVVNVLGILSVIF